MNSTIKIALTFLAASASAYGFAQTTNVDSLAKEVAALKKQSGVLANLKISGFIQAQYQYADTVGAKTFNGGNFGKETDNRFSVRRARLKVAYERSFGSAVIQINVGEKGVDVKNAYINLIAPFAKPLSLTGGIFDRPFGYAISYSSTAMEVVERPIVFETLFPSQQDVGAMLSFDAPSSSVFSGLKVSAGFFNGNAINQDVDKYKDFIGHLSFDGFGLGDNVHLNLGASTYIGNVYNPAATVYEMRNGAFAPTTEKVGAKLRRRYVGFDGQLSIKTAIGKTQLVSEYIWGKQPGTEKSSASPSYSTLPTGDAYLRDFAGGYATLIQNIYQFAVFGRYEWYDPNTKVSGNEVGKAADMPGGKATNATDLTQQVVSLGAFYEPVKNIRFTAQYDFNSFDGTDNGKFSVAGLKNNLLTLRVQYKF